MVAVIGIVVGVLGLVYAFYLMFKVFSYDLGNEKSIRASQAIREGVVVFIRCQHTYLFFVTLILAVGLGFLFGLIISIGFVIGVFLAGLVNVIGLMIITKTNLRTTEAARKGIFQAFDVAFKSAASTSLITLSIALLIVVISYLIVKNPMLLFGIAFGACVFSFSAKVGGNIFAKTGDMGFEVATNNNKKMEAVDYRNPAMITTIVGDVVGDSGSAIADMFDSYVILFFGLLIFTTIPTMVIDVYAPFEFPLLLASVGLFATLIGLKFVRLGKEKNVFGAFYKGLVTASAIAIMGDFGITLWTGNSLNLFFASMVGIVMILLIVILMEYYTGEKYKTIQKVVNLGLMGENVHLMSSFRTGILSIILPIILISFGVITTYYLAGFYGIVISGVCMVSLMGMILSFEIFRPIVKNAREIGEMISIEPGVKKNLHSLDTNGNMITAVTKAISICVTAITGIILFFVFIQEINLFSVKQFDFLLTKPVVMMGLFMGIMLSFVFVALSFKAIEKVVNLFAVEVKKCAKFMMKKDSQCWSCVDVVAKFSFRNIFSSFMLAIFAPLFIGLIFGVLGLTGFLVGFISSSFVIALFFSNTGVIGDIAYDIRTRKLRLEKGSNSNLFRGSTGSILNTFVKFILLFALLFIPLFLGYGLNVW